MEVGCRDKSLPFKSATNIINYPLYFAKESVRWQKQGVAFIGLKKDTNYKTYSRQYLITEEQFFDVVKQENNGIDLKVDLNEVKKHGTMKIRDSWYGTIVYLGEKDGYPIFTFTSEWDLEVPFNKPSKEYLHMIIDGLQEDVQLTSAEVIDYLITKPGIAGNYNKEDLKKQL